MKRSGQTVEAPEGTSDFPPAMPSWSADGSWRTSWESPRNWIFGEGDQIATVGSLVGVPSEHGHLVPVDVLLEREPRNCDDRNAVRASVRGQVIGYLARTIAAQVSQTMELAGLQQVAVPGIVRGGQLTAPHLGVYVWLDRGAEKLHVHDDGGRVSWPPQPDEGGI